MVILMSHVICNVYCNIHVLQSFSKSSNWRAETLSLNSYNHSVFSLYCNTGNHVLQSFFKSRNGNYSLSSCCNLDRRTSVNFCSVSKKLSVRSGYLKGPPTANKSHSNQTFKGAFSRYSLLFMCSSIFSTSKDIGRCVGISNTRL